MTTIKRSTLVDILGSAAVMDGSTIGAIRFLDSDGGEVYGADSEDIEQLSFDEGDGINSSMRFGKLPIAPVPLSIGWAMGLAARLPIRPFWIMFPPMFWPIRDR